MTSIISTFADVVKYAIYTILLIFVARIAYGVITIVMKKSVEFLRGDVQLNVKPASICGAVIMSSRDKQGGLTGERVYLLLVNDGKAFTLDSHTCRRYAARNGRISWNVSPAHSSQWKRMFPVDTDLYGLDIGEHHSFFNQHYYFDGEQRQWALFDQDGCLIFKGDGNRRQCTTSLDGFTSIIDTDSITSLEMEIPLIASVAERQEANLNSVTSSIVNELDTKQVVAIRSLFITVLSRWDIERKIAQARMQIEQAQGMLEKHQGDAAARESRRVLDREMRVLEGLVPTREIVEQQERRVLRMIDTIRDYRIKIEDRADEVRRLGGAVEAMSDVVDMATRLTGGLATPDEIDSSAGMVSVIENELLNRIQALKDLVQQIHLDTGVANQDIDPSGDPVHLSIEENRPPVDEGYY